MAQRHQPEPPPTDPADGREPRHLASLGPARRARAILGTVPLVIVSSIAMSVGLASPASASTPVRKIDRTKAPDSAARAQRSVAHPRLAENVPQSYVVAAGDTVSSIAGRFGLSTAGVLAANGLSWSSLIFPGQVLALGDGRAAAPVAPAPAPIPITRYTIVSGDTISGIAAAHGLDTQTVLTANGLELSSVIFPGQSIVLPDRGTAIDAQPVADVVPLPAAPSPSPVPAPAPAPAPAAVVALTDEMRANATIIVQVGRSEGVDDQGLIIALAAAMQESGLRNLPAGDRDSVGLFQQRPSMGWGTPEQILDPVTAARSFFGGAGNPHPGLTRGLLDIDGWQSMTLTEAAQAVQRSGSPDSYAEWEPSARAWLPQLG